MDAKKLSEENLIFKGTSGSHAYGLATPESDIDTRGVFCPPIEELLNPLDQAQQVNDDKNDSQLYSFAKYFKLLFEQNPNIIELLWLPEEMIEIQKPIWIELKKHREQLLSKKSFWKFSKYASSQLGRIKGHNKWIEREERGIAKLKSLYNDGKISKEWLSQNFNENIISKVIINKL